MSDDDDRRNGTAPPFPAPPHELSTPDARAEFVAYWQAVEAHDRAEGVGKYAPGGLADPHRPTSEQHAAELSAWREGIDAERRSWERKGHGLDVDDADLVRDENGEDAADRTHRLLLDVEVDRLRIRREAVQVLAAEDRVWPRVLGVAEFLDLPTPEPLVEGLLYVDSLTRLFGPPGTYKSFLALDLALRIALGWPWHGCRTRQAPVLYVMAEGGRVNVDRVRAWLAHHQVDRADIEGRFHMMTEAVPLTEEGVRPLVEEVTRVGAGLVVIDTKHACLIGDENSAADVAVMRRALDAVRTASQCCVTLIDHTGYDTGRARGSSAVTAMIDTEVSVKAGPGRLTVQVTRDKAARSGLTRSFEVVPVAPAAVLVPSAVPVPDPEGGDGADGGDAAVTRRPMADWQTAETILPADVWDFDGPGAAAMRTLARYLVHDASREHADPGQVGSTRAEATRELGKVGQSEPSVRRAWSALIKMGRIAPAPGVSRRAATGRHVWVADPVQLTTCQMPSDDLPDTPVTPP